MRQGRQGRQGGQGRKFNHATPQNKVVRLLIEDKLRDKRLHCLFVSFKLGDVKCLMLNAKCLISWKF